MFVVVYKHVIEIGNDGVSIWSKLDGCIVLIFGDYPVLSRSIFRLLCTVRFVVVYT